LLELAPRRVVGSRSLGQIVHAQYSEAAPSSKGWPVETARWYCVPGQRFDYGRGRHSDV